MASKRLILSLLMCLILLSSCTGGQTPQPTAATAPETSANPDNPSAAPQATLAAVAATPNANEVAKQVADLLQSCSYDGKPVKFGQGPDAPADCRDMVTQVMEFSGLPQNFDVIEAEVPNAAAAILVDQENLPHRVIGFNPDFIKEANQAANGNSWAAVSIMAHEIGHHLAGHTIQPGGSQPPIELEADKYSGFVLYKMGASLDDSLAAIRALVPEGPDGPTHPGQGKRVSAITEGWMQACVQSHRINCDNGQAFAGANTAQAGQPTTAPEATTEATAEPTAEATAEATAEPEATSEPSQMEGQGDILPVPDPNALPSKTTQFFYDEYGIFKKEDVAKWEKVYYEHAQKTGVELVTIITKDLHGLSAEEYGQAMLRQLRVGKLDVGSGGVIVYAPDANASAVVLGPGVYHEVRDYIGNYPELLKSGTEMLSCKDTSVGCLDGTMDVLMLATEAIRTDTSDRDWMIKYQSFADIHAAHLKASQSGNLNNDPANNAIAKIQGKVDEVNANVDNSLMDDFLVKGGYQAMKATGSNGEHLVLYVRPETMDLMPAAKLEPGKEYIFIAREKLLLDNAKDDIQQFIILSYDLVAK